MSPEVSVDRSRRKHGNIEPESWGTLLAQTEAHATSPLTQPMKELALLALRQHFMFASFSVARLSRLVDQMASRSFSPGSHVITQGDSDAHEMFVVFSGEVEVMVRKEDGRGIQVPPAASHHHPSPPPPPRLSLPLPPSPLPPLSSHPPAFRLSSPLPRSSSPLGV